MYCGNLDRQPCWISSNSPNQSVCLTGISGMGKTTRLNIMELTEVQTGGTILILDMNQTHTDSRLFPPVQKEFQKFLNRIDMLQDGLGAGLLQPMHTQQGTEEPFFHLVNSAVKALSSSQNMGARQIAALRQAVIGAINHLNEFATEAEALAFFLLQQENSYAEAVYQKLWTVLNCGALRPSTKFIQEGKINIMDLSGADSITQVCLAEIALSNLWRTIRFHSQETARQEVVIVLDEFQNLSLKSDAVLRNMLCEGRKFGISLLLATQTLEVFPKDIIALLNQAATRLFFRPAQNEAKKIAQVIDFENVHKWMKELLNLKIGESIAVGNLCAGNMEIFRPVILR